MIQKNSIILFLIILFGGGFTLNAQSNDKLKLTIIPQSGEYKFKDTKLFEFWVKNISDEIVMVITPLKTQPYRGGYKTLWFTSMDGKVEPPVSNKPPMASPSPEKKGLVALKPGESVMVDKGSFSTPSFGTYKVWGVFVQDPETLISEYRKKLGKDADKLQSFELHSDTLTYDFTAKCSPLEKEPDYKDLTVVKQLNSSVKSYDFDEYSINEYLYALSTDLTRLVRLKVSSKDDNSMIEENAHLMKNLRGLNLQLKSGEAIPDYVREFSNLVSLTITVEDNWKSRIPLQGLDDLDVLKSLQYLELRNTFIDKCPQWIIKSSSMRALIIPGGSVSDFSQVSSIPNLEMLSINIATEQQANIDLSKATNLKELSLRNYGYELSKNFLLKLKELQILTVNAKQIEFVPELTGLNIENLRIVLEDNIADHYPIGMETLSQLKRLELTGCFNNIAFPDLSGCKNIDFVDITDRSMTEVPANLKELKMKVANYTLRAPKVPQDQR